MGETKRDEAIEALLDLHWPVDEQSPTGNAWRDNVARERVERFIAALDARYQRIAAARAADERPETPPPWYGVWATRDGYAGHWHCLHDGTRAPLETTHTEATRVAKALNEFAAERTDSLGWKYEVRPYVASPASSSAGEAPEEDMVACILCGADMPFGSSHECPNDPAMLKAKLAEAEASLRDADADNETTATQLLAAQRDRDRMATELADALAWSDEEESQPEAAAIHAAHPTRTGKYETHAEARRLVGKRRSKGSLIDLVNWLLVGRATERSRREAAGERVEHLESALRQEKADYQVQERVTNDLDAAIARAEKAERDLSEARHRIDLALKCLRDKTYAAAVQALVDGDPNAPAPDGAKVKCDHDPRDMHDGHCPHCPPAPPSERKETCGTCGHASDKHGAKGCTVKDGRMYCGCPLPAPSAPASNNDTNKKGPTP